MPFFVPLEIKTSPLGGNGLFALQDIPKGTKYWAFKAKEGEEAVALKNTVGAPLEAEKGNAVLVEADMEKLSDDEARSIFWKGYAHEPAQVWIKLEDGAQFTNHSTQPNSGGDWLDEPSEEFAITIRDIKAGEEICDDYGTFHGEKVPWIAKLMEKLSPDRYAFEKNVVKPLGKGEFHGVQ